MRIGGLVIMKAVRVSSLPIMYNSTSKEPTSLDL